MMKIKKRHFGSALLALLLVACGGDKTSQTTPTPTPSKELTPLNIKSTFSATFQQTIKKDETGQDAQNEHSAQLKTQQAKSTSKSYDGKMEVTDLLTATKEVFDWPLTQTIDTEGNITTVSHRALTLKSGSYDFILLLTSKDSGNHQYTAKAIGQIIVEGENPIIDFVLSPNRGDAISNFEQIKYLSTLKFSWPISDLTALVEPRFGLSINQGDEVIYRINKTTGMSELSMNLEPGQYQLAIRFYDGDLMIGKNAEENTTVNLIEGEDVVQNIIPLQADINISLDPIKNEGIFTFIVPSDVVDEVGGAQNLTLLVRLGGNSAPVQEKVLSVLDENGVFKASSLFQTDGQSSVTAYLAFHRTREAPTQFSEAPFASCNTNINLEQTQTLACKLELKREGMITGRLLATLMLNVLNDANQSAMGAEIYLNGKLIGLTGKDYSTGSIKTHQVAGNYNVKAKKAGLSASAEVELAPLEVKNELLYLVPSSEDNIPDFSFSSITPSTQPKSKMMLSFAWDGASEGNTYKVCVKDISQPNHCSAQASVTGKNQLDVALKSTYLLADKDFFILASRGSLTQKSQNRKISTVTINSLIQYIKPWESTAQPWKSTARYFGSSVSLSADGKLLAVGSQGRDEVYILRKGADGWQQNERLRASNYDAFSNEFFGESLSLSADGNTLAVGAYGEDSHATGVDGDQTDNSKSASGAVYVFKRNADSWQQQAYLKASNTDRDDWFGRSAISLSADGNTLAVGAQLESSNAKGIDGDQTDNSLKWAGAVYVFKRNADTWQQQTYLKASNTGTYDSFGISLSLSADGNTLAVGASGESSNATGLDGDQANNTKNNSGAVYVFKQNSDTWQQQAYLKASNTDRMDAFGGRLSLSADGNTLAVGARGEDSGIAGNQTDNTKESSGAVYIFKQSAQTWQQQAYLKASNMDSRDFFGNLSLSADGNTLAVGAEDEASNAVGLDGDQADNSAKSSGAVYLFKQNNDIWLQHIYLKAPNSEAKDKFSTSLSLSADGSTLAVGAMWEDSNATEVNGNQADNSKENSGAVYIY